MSAKKDPWRHVTPFSSWGYFRQYVQLLDRIMWPEEVDSFGHLVESWNDNECWDADLADIMRRSGCKKRCLWR